LTADDLNFWAWKFFQMASGTTSADRGPETKPCAGGRNGSLRSGRRTVCSGG